MLHVNFFRRTLRHSDINYLTSEWSKGRFNELEEEGISSQGRFEMLRGLLN